jgi:hypothetical protein
MKSLIQLKKQHVIAIGADASSGTAYAFTYIGGIYDSLVDDRPVYIRSDGALGTLVSSRRYKEEIKPMGKASEALFALKPVTFRYRQEIDPSDKLSFGLIAEDVAEISTDLVSRDKEGKPQTVRYEAVNAMLLNEFLKEHRKVEEQEATISQLKKEFQTAVAQQQKEIQALTAQLKERAAQIQKVSAQLEINKPTPKAVRNRAIEVNRPYQTERPPRLRRGGLLFYNRAPGVWALKIARKATSMASAS